MTSILRRVVAGPRLPHTEANLDLCYVTDHIIATSGPSKSYPSLAYRNPLDALVRFLDSKHGANWCIWEFRAEGTGYPDDAVYNRIWHFPWPDHHPPPFALVPKIMSSMHAWVQSSTDAAKKVIVVHCKAGKGRSGSMAISYLITHEAWALDSAVQRFTDRRMRPGFGPGISIPSQKRWLRYVERWAAYGQRYADARIQVTEVHLWGLRPGTRVAIEGFVDAGRVIKTMHVFSASEAHTDDADAPEKRGLVDAVRHGTSRTASPAHSGASTPGEDAGTNTIFRPATAIALPTRDVNLSVERRSRGTVGWSMVTSVAHVWFNTFFEGQGPENFAKGAHPDGSGTFEIAWDAMDGIKGSARKGTRAFDRAAVVWRVVSETESGETGGISGEHIVAGPAADPQAPVRDEGVGKLARDTGLRKAGPQEEASVDAKSSVGTGVKEVLQQGKTSVKRNDKDEVLDEGGSDEDGAEGVRRGIVE